MKIITIKNPPVSFLFRNYGKFEGAAVMMLLWL